jgi:hypothetical protein
MFPNRVRPIIWKDEVVRSINNPAVGRETLGGYIDIKTQGVIK